MQVWLVDPLLCRQLPQFCPQVELSVVSSQVLVFRFRILPAAQEVQVLGALAAQVIQLELHLVHEDPVKKALGQQDRQTAGWSTSQVRQELLQGLQYMRLPPATV